MSGNDALTLLIRPEWFDDAACRGMQPNNFFIDEFDPDYDAKVAVAKRVCSSCSVRSLCFEEAKERQEEFGIWGGINVEDPDFSW